MSPCTRACAAETNTPARARQKTSLLTACSTVISSLTVLPAHACTQTHTLADQVSLDVVSAHGDGGPAKCHSILTGEAPAGLSGAT